MRHIRSTAIFPAGCLFILQICLLTAKIPGPGVKLVVVITERKARAGNISYTIIAEAGESRRVARKTLFVHSD